MTTTAVNNKRYGFNAESELLQYFREHSDWIGGAERLHLTGKEDEGDLALFYESASSNLETMIVQLKTLAPRAKDGTPRSLPPGRVRLWWKALKDQCHYYGLHRGLSEVPEGILIVKVRGQSWDDAMVIQRLGDWV